MKEEKLYDVVRGPGHYTIRILPSTTGKALADAQLEVALQYKEWSVQLQNISDQYLADRDEILFAPQIEEK